MVLFSVELNHGGRFIEEPIYHYGGGLIQLYDDVDGDWLNVDKINNLPKMFGYKKNTAVYFKMSGLDIRNGLELICDDHSIRLLIEEGEKFGIVDLYCDHSIDEVLPLERDFEQVVEREVDVVDVQLDAPMEYPTDDDSTGEKTDDECTDVSDDDENEELINVRLHKEEIKKTKIKDLEVVCEVELDDEVEVQCGEVHVEDMGTQASSSVHAKKTSDNQKTTENKGRKKRKAGLNKANKKQKNVPEEQMEVEPTFSSDDDVVTKFGTKGMKLWEEMYEDSDIEVPASPPSKI